MARKMGYWFTHSIFPDVTLQPWFMGQKEERRFVRSYLGKFRIVEDLMGVCAGDYETVEHLIGTVKDLDWKNIVSLMCLPC
jgi:hypothetical protein